MSVRIFVKFRTSQVPCEPGRKVKYVADAACSVLLGRDFDHKKDFLHSQGELYCDNAPCHILIDCEYRHPLASKEVPLHCYAVEVDNLQDKDLQSPSKDKCAPRPN
ncbi:hypothetical protein CC80DRAFT_14604 [Byssothecium circinans]|uniref:Uncharacterized protein n=1 Tax=Byssothecium circinans TaxID=147558 RepID=A0A6A5U1Q6_9PLEO|nr:hypothetical protein CC80DRAFT_14604 [Byssothecium circinans]